MAALISFLGFIVENIWLAATKGYRNNRNMNALCGLLYVCCDDIQDIALCTALPGLVAIFMEVLRTEAIKITNAVKKCSKDKH